MRTVLPTDIDYFVTRLVFSESQLVSYKLSNFVFSELYTRFKNVR